MKGDPIPSEHHLAIHCQRTDVEIDGDGKATSVTRDVFRVDDDGMSSNWIEFGGGRFNDACLMIARCRKVRPRHNIGVFNVGSAHGIGLSHEKDVFAVHDPIEVPDPPNPGHALLKGILADDFALLEQLALLVVLRPFTSEALQLAKAGRPG